MAKIASKKTATKPEPKVETPEVEISEEVQAIVAEFKSKLGRDPKVSIEDIQTAADGEGDTERSMDEWVDYVRSLEGADEKEAKQPHVISSEAKELAIKLVKTEGFVTDLDQLVQVKDAAKRLPGQLGLYIYTNVSKEERAALPIPGSKLSERPKGSNEPYDIGKVGEPSFYQDVLASLDVPQIKQIFADIERVRTQKGPGPDADKKMFQQRKTNATRGLKDGVNICLRMDEIHDTCKLKCGFRINPDDKTKIQRTTAPIWVRPEDDTSGEGVRFFGVGEFLQIKLDMVRDAKNDTPSKQMAAFKVDRKARRKKGDAAAEPINIYSANQGTQAISELAAVFNNEPDVTDGMFKELTAKDSDDLLLDAHDVQSRLGRWLERPAIKSRLAKLLEQRDAEETEEKKQAA